MDNQLLKQIANNIVNLSQPFFKQPDFYIFLVLGLLSLFLSYKAFKEAEEAKLEAGKAKEAAKEAGKSIKIQTITLELLEIAQKLEALNQNISYSDGRSLFQEVNRKTRRLLSPYQEETEFKTTITKILTILEDFQTSLLNVRPVGQDVAEIPYQIFNAIENDISDLVSALSDLIGLFDNRNLNGITSKG